MPFVDKGTYGCIFSPALKCVNKKQLSNNTVGKIFSDNDEYLQEKETNEDLIKSLDPNHKWTVPYLGTCKTDIREANKQDEIEKCSHINKSDTIKEQLILTHGGISLSKLQKNIDKYPDFTIDELILMFLPLIKGIISLDKKEFCHLDIKPANILYNVGQNKLYLIDFGLLTAYSNLIYMDILLNYDYPYYPPEMKMLHSILVNQRTLKSNKEILKNFKYYNTTNFLNKLKPFINYEEQLQKFINDNKDNEDEFMEYLEEQYTSKIDIYSLGISFFEIYYFLKINDQLDNHINNNDFVNDSIHKVLSMMIHPNAKERLSPNDAYKELSKIIKHYKLSKKYKTSGVKVSVSSSPPSKSKSPPIKLPSIPSPKKNSLSPTDYSKYTVKQLKQTLREKGRPVTGNKTELLQRVSKAKTPPINLSTLSQTECEKMSVSKIKALLQEKNKATYGSKKVLCERLLKK